MNLLQIGTNMMYRITDTSITVFQLHNLIKKNNKKTKKKTCKYFVIQMWEVFEGWQKAKNMNIAQIHTEVYRIKNKSNFWFEASDFGFVIPFRSPFTTN